MTKYIIRRLLISVPVLIGVTVIVFGLAELAPGDVSDMFINPELELGPEDMEALREKFGLNDPVPVRYLKWAGSVLQGDLGFSYVTGRPVADQVSRRLGNTLLLAGTSLAISIVVGIGLGVFTALRQYSFWDFTLTGLSFLGTSMPAFVSGIMGLYVFSIKLRIFPTGGMRPVTREPTLFDTVHHLTLPALILGIQGIASYMRYTRFSMLEVIHSDYVTTARAKGLPERAITWRHGVRNAILPVVTVIGLSIPNLVVGAVFLETIFSWPGMGTLYLDAVQGRDVPLLMGMNLVFATVILLANIITDVAYSIVDPRIRYD